MSIHSISVDIGSFDFYLDNLAASITEAELEAEMLDAMSDQVQRVAHNSGDASEKEFLNQLTSKLRELSQWIEENTPS